MKINWFSSLSPTRPVIVEFSRRAELTVWPNEYDAARPRWPEISRADITFYELENDAATGDAIWQISRLHPGVVLLRDCHMQDFFLGLVEREKLSRREYLQLIERHHGLSGRVAGEAFFRGEIAAATLAGVCPMIGAASENSLHLIASSARSVGETQAVEAYVDHLMEVANRVAEFQGRWLARHLAERAGSSIAEWSRALPDDSVFSGLAKKIQLLASGTT